MLNHNSKSPIRIVTSLLQRVEFTLGKRDLRLEVPPFFLEPKKGRLRSILVRKQPKTARGVMIYIFVTQSGQAQKLMELKSIHPDLFIPKELPVVAEVSGEELQDFGESVLELEKDWPYEGNGMWKRDFDSCTVHMVLMIKEDMWTVRPTVSKEGISGYGVEIPIDTNLAEEFEKDLVKDELEEIHDHTVTLHYHLKLDDLKRYIQLAKKWDYYFFKEVPWPAIFDIVFPQEREHKKRF